MFQGLPYPGYDRVGVKVTEEYRFRSVYRSGFQFSTPLREMKKRWAISRVYTPHHSLTPTDTWGCYGNRHGTTTELGTGGGRGDLIWSLVDLETDETSADIGS